MKKTWVFFFVVAFCGLALAQNDDYNDVDYYDNFNKLEVEQPDDVNKQADDDQIINDKQDYDYGFDDTFRGWFEDKNDGIEKAVDESVHRPENNRDQLDTDSKVYQENQQVLGDIYVGQDAEALDENDYQVEDNRPIMEEEQIKPDESDDFKIRITEDSNADDFLEDTDSEMDINRDENFLENDGIINENEVNGSESEEVRDVNLDKFDSLESEELDERGTNDKEDLMKNIKRLSEVKKESAELEKSNDGLQNESNSDEVENADNRDKVDANFAKENEQVNSENNSEESAPMDEDENKKFWVIENEDDKLDENQSESEDSDIENSDDNINDNELEESINELNYIYDNVIENTNGNVEKDKTEEDNFEENSDLIDEEKNGRPFREEYILGLREQVMDDETNINDESLNEEINENYQNNFNDPNEPDDLENVGKNYMVAEIIPYLNDAINNENEADIVNDDDIENNNDIETDDGEIAVDHVDQLLHLVKEAHVLFSPNLDNLTNSELEDLDKQFSIDHKEDLDVNSENFDRNVAPILMYLEVGVPVVITSPNYPEPYPTNNIIDWILEGTGMGIELNITDLSVNGFIGDYVLVKPGGIDESGHEGLLFSYELRSVRRYRFLDVNRLFVRFEALPGTALSRGFSYSVKLISHLPEPEEPMPEPEPVGNHPFDTLLVFLGGITTEEFKNIQEEFRMIVVDMATVYINAKEIHVGNVSINHATHITRVEVCHITWPGFEHCAGVSFGIQLASEVTSGLSKSQLNEVWRNYVHTDPFAARLRRLGVTEFVVPNDSANIMVWLVIGLGVVISAGMLALALWRWTCYDEYTRMPAFNDTDSIMGNEKKRNLDLYPTPHQTLPPLYNDEFIKYEDATRVDVGGFANQSYTRDAELYDLESDDDVGELPVSRQHRNTNIRPKDIYEVC